VSEDEPRPLPTLEPPPLQPWSIGAIVRVAAGSLIAGAAGFFTIIFALYLITLSTRPPNSPRVLLYALPIVLVAGSIPMAIGALIVRSGLRRHRQEI
jgi:hypothetical protein